MFWTSIKGIGIAAISFSPLFVVGYLIPAINAGIRCSKTHINPAQFDACLLVVLGICGIRGRDRLASEAFDSGRNAEYRESREYGFPTLLDPDLDDLRSEVALSVPATDEHEFLILARPQ